MLHVPNIFIVILATSIIAFGSAKKASKKNRERRNVLVIGDSVDRQMVTELCKVIRCKLGKTSDLLFLRDRCNQTLPSACKSHLFPAASMHKVMHWPIHASIARIPHMQCCDGGPHDK